MRHLFAGDDVKEEFDAVAEAFAAWPRESDRDYLKRTRSAMLYLRILLIDLRDLKSAKQLTQLLARLRGMTEAHKRTLPDSAR